MFIRNPIPVLIKNGIKSLSSASSSLSSKSHLFPSPQNRFNKIPLQYFSTQNNERKFSPDLHLNKIWNKKSKNIKSIRKYIFSKIFEIQYIYYFEYENNINNIIKDLKNKCQ